jgi:hypothetical protein
MFMFMRITVVALLAWAMSANAQNPGPGRGHGGPGPFDAGGQGGPGEPRILGATPGRQGPVVRGAPYSATMVTEITQVLPDGNRIRQTSTAKIFRDSEGRVRSELSLAGLGALGPAMAASVNSGQVVFITDPVAGVDYVLNQKDKTATKTPGQGRGGRPPAGPGMGDRRSDERSRGSRQQPERDWKGGPGRGNQKVKVDSLGRQTIDGIAADGTRTTMTIPAGQIGNEQPILIVSERWYSPELQAVVLSRHSDPRTGEALFRLASVSRSEPAPGLFQPPSDYKLKNARGDDRRFPERAK